MKKLVVLLLTVGALSACSDEVGSKNWCSALRDKPKTEWTGQNAVDFAQYCVFQNEIGNQAWCEDMDRKPKGDWSANEATSYAKHCIF
ncbi:DUF3012 domain-containing protein [Vibrio proteolyticus]